MQDGESKLCPYCKEQIRASAIKCRYCGEWLEEKPESSVVVADNATNSTPTPPSPEQPEPPTADSDRIDQTASPPVLAKAEDNRPTKRSPESRNYFVRHWRGELTLGVSYWVNCQLFWVAYFVGFAVVAQISMAINPWSAVPQVVAMCLFFIIVTCWQVVGTWRSAQKHDSRGGTPTVALLAKIVMLVWAVTAVKSLSTDWVSLVAGTYKAVAASKSIPACNVRALPGGKSVEITGGLPFGSADKLAAVLKATPQATVVRVNSPGGLLREAQKAGHLIRQRGLSTYTDGCASAAAFVFLSGKERTIGERARVGFHAPSSYGLWAGEQNFNDSIARETMGEAGVPEDFITRVLTTPNSDMWYPSADELRAAGVITKEDVPLKTFAANMVSFLDNMTNAGGFKLEATGHEDIDRITKTFAEFSRRWSDLFVEMKAELEQTGEPNVYSDPTLQDQKKIREALSIQSKRKQIVERYRSKAHEETRWLTNECAAIKSSDATAKGMIEGMNRLAETGRAQADQLLNLVSDEEAAKERFLSFMLETFSDYRLVNSKISFSKQADVERYRALEKAIADSSKALEVFQTEMLESVGAAKEQLKKLAR